MSAATLPIEIWQKIFRYCTGKSVVKYRRVCKFWKLAIDGLPDDVWKEIFIRERGDAECDVEQARVSWRDMYKSVTLWRNIRAAKISHKDLPTTCVQQFQVLHNGILAVVQDTSADQPSRPTGYGNTIIYFDLDTLEEISRETFDFFFSKYHENEKFITLIHEDQRLCVIPKANKKRYFVGELLSIIPGSSGEYTMCEKEVFYKRTDDMLCVSKVVDENGEVIVKTEELEDFEEHVLAFSYGSSDFSCHDIYILTNEGNIYNYKNKDFETIDTLDSYSQCILHRLSSFGFNWTAHSIYTWLTKSFSQQTLKISTLMVTNICRHSKCLLFGTANRKIHIFYNPYKPNGDLKSYKGKPDREIDVNKIYPSTGEKKIQQLHVVERVNGHRILALTNGKVLILDLVYDEEKEREKEPTPVGPNEKRQKKSPETLPESKLRYATRASLKK